MLSVHTLITCVHWSRMGPVTVTEIPWLMATVWHWFSKYTKILDRVNKKTIWREFGWFIGVGFANRFMVSLGQCPFPYWINLPWSCYFVTWRILMFRDKQKVKHLMLTKTNIFVYHNFIPWRHLSVRNRILCW